MDATETGCDDPAALDPKDVMWMTVDGERISAAEVFGEMSEPAVETSRDDADATAEGAPDEPADEEEKELVEEAPLLAAID